MASDRTTIWMAAALVCGLALGPPVAAAGSLPAVASGARPGPDVLYAPPPAAPQLESRDPRFTAPPLLVSGQEAYVAGEYLYQDFLYDDWGSNTDGIGQIPQCAHAGDLTYPTDTARYGNNAADLVELRIAVSPSEVAYRITLNTLLEPDSTIVAIAYDTDGSALTGTATLPRNPGAPFPGTDQVIFVWGTGAEHVVFPPAGGPVTTPLAAPTTDLDANQITLTVPRLVSDPSGVWRATVAVGLYDPATGGWKLPQLAADAARPGGAGPLDPAPAGIFNLAFRFTELACPPGALTCDVPPDTNQAAALATKTPTTFAHAIDFDKLDAGVTESSVPATGMQLRIFPSRLDLGEGREAAPQCAPAYGPFPQYRGQLQPYALYVPGTYVPATPAGLTLALHSLGEHYWQYNGSVILQQIGEARGNLVATALARGPDGWYQHEGEYDVFEMWADVARHFALDPDRAAVSGYSMGGYATYRLGTLYPDLFGKAFSQVGPPADGIWIPPLPPTGGMETLTNLWLENARNLPFLNLASAADELVPFVGPRAQNLGAPELGIDGFDQLGYRFRFLVFPVGDHFAPAAAGYDFPFATAFLGDALVDRNPPHVTFAYAPAGDDAALALVHDHAYWVSDLELADAAPSGDVPAKGVVDAFSHGFGRGDPASTPGVDAGVAGLFPYTEVNRTWGAAPAIPVANRLDLTLVNLASVRLDLARAALQPTARLTMPVTSDGNAVVLLDGAFLPGAVVLEDDVPLPGGTAGPDGAVVPVKAGTHTYVIDLTPGCPAAPSAGCREQVAPGAGLLAITDRPGDARDRTVWKWLKGAVATIADFGDPQATTSYDWCLYDAGGTLVSSAAAPAGGLCGTKPCWKRTKRGFTYRRRDIAPSGTRTGLQIVLKEGLADGKAKIIVKGKGGEPSTPPLPAAQPLTAQLKHADGACWTATYGAPARANDGTRFKDTGD